MEEIDRKQRGPKGRDYGKQKIVASQWRILIKALRRKKNAASKKERNLKIIK